MKRILWSALLVCLAAGPALADKVSKVEMTEFKAMVDRYGTAWGTLNPDNAAAFYAKDPDLVFYDIAPLKYTGWTEYANGTRTMFADFETMKMVPNDDLKVTRQGKVTWTTVTMHLSGKMKAAAPFELDIRQTAIWEKRDGKWLIVHEHFSTPLQHEAPKKN